MTEPISRIERDFTVVAGDKTASTLVPMPERAHHVEKTEQETILCPTLAYTKPIIPMLFLEAAEKFLGHGNGRRM